MKRNGIILCLFTGILAFAFFSCSNAPKHPRELAEADSLCRVARATDSILRTTDTSEVKKMIQNIGYTLAYIQFNRKDTLSKEEGIELSTFFLLKRPLVIFMKKQDEIRRKNKLELEQCLNLAHDLRHNTLDSKLDAAGCVEKERLRSGAISQSLASIFPSVHDIEKNYSDMLPKMEDRLRLLKATGGKEPPASRTDAGKDDDDE